MRLVTFFSGSGCVKCKSIKKWWNEVVVNHTFYDFRIEDTDESLEMAAKYHVASLPTFLITEDGKEIARCSGEVSKKTMEDFLNKNKV